MDYQDNRRIALLFIAVMSNVVPGAHAEEQPKFSLPLNCENGTTCFLQSYVDIDLTRKRQDPFCGTATYNGHKGTDIRVQTIAQLKGKIPILAMADGVVVGMRNGMTDRLAATQSDFEKLKGKECGNGVVINHPGLGDGKWQTQLCHLAKGSVRLKKSDRVKRGDMIGFMGLSGATQFPHIHFTVRHKGKFIDPVRGIAAGGSCQPEKDESLLTDKAAKTLKNIETPLLESGFASGRVSGKTLLFARAPKVTAKGPMVFYAKFLNLHKGDQIRLTLTGPEGPMAQSTTKPLDRPKATYTAYTGKQGEVGSGNYEGKADLLRNGKIIFSSNVNRLSF